MAPVDKEKKAFNSTSLRPDSKGEIVDDRSSADASKNTLLAPGLDGVEGMDDPATAEDVDSGDSTRVTKLVYDEYDESQP